MPGKDGPSGSRRLSLPCGSMVAAGVAVSEGGGKDRFASTEESSGTSDHRAVGLVHWGRLFRGIPPVGKRSHGSGSTSGADFRAASNFLRLARRPRDCKYSSVISAANFSAAAELIS